MYIIYLSNSPTWKRTKPCHIQRVLEYQVLVEFCCELPKRPSYLLDTGVDAPTLFLRLCSC